ncbi:MAG TPA: right-handed parallel beta-helix repeat-containing protein [Polyangiaceae bacterium]
MRRWSCASLALLIWSYACPASAKTYEVGPGKPYTAIGAVPWESLVGGDTVLIHWRDTPYKEKWVIGGRGSATLPIVVRGVLGPSGQRPVIDGNGATTRAQLSFWNPDRSVLKIGGSSSPPNNPSYIVVENLDIGGGRSPATFTTSQGSSMPYRDNAASIMIENGDHITIRNCIARDSANGIFSAHDSSQVLIEANHIHGNGRVGDIYVHNNYTESNGIVFQYNRLGPLCAGCSGNNLKDRSAGTVIRYNFIESGNRQLDLVESGTFAAAPSYRATYVYGNVLVEPDGAGNSQIVHYGGDNGDTSTYRKGTLYFHNNTVVSTRAGNTTLLRLSSNDESADVRNNVLYVSAAGNRLGMLDGNGRLTLAKNWLKSSWVGSHGTLSLAIQQPAPQVSATSPGFVNEAAQDYRLLATSSCVNGGGSVLADATHFAVRQYVAHLSSEVRPDDGPVDIGAFEYASGGAGASCDASSESAPAAAWMVGGLFGFVLTRRRRPATAPPV